MSFLCHFYLHLTGFISVTAVHLWYKLISLFLTSFSALVAFFSYVISKIPNVPSKYQHLRNVCAKIKFGCPSIPTVYADGSRDISTESGNAMLLDIKKWIMSVPRIEEALQYTFQHIPPESRHISY